MPSTATPTTARAASPSTTSNALRIVGNPAAAHVGGHTAQHTAVRAKPAELLRPVYVHARARRPSTGYFARNVTAYPCCGFPLQPALPEQPELDGRETVRRTQDATRCTADVGMAAWNAFGPRHRQDVIEAEAGGGPNGLAQINFINQGVVTRLSQKESEQTPLHLVRGGFGITSRTERSARCRNKHIMPRVEYAAVGALAIAALLIGADVAKETVLSVVIGMLVLCVAALLTKGDSPAPSGALTSCPATSWPAGKPMLTTPKAYPKYNYERDPKGSFNKICDMLIAEIKDELPKMYELPERENEWIEKMLEYNTKGGKMTRGLMVVETAVIIFKARGMPVDNTTMCKFAVLGWCIEWLQAWLLVADDMMDESVTRRGQPCWYKSKTDKGNPVGTIAINDAVTIEALVYKILKRHFSQDACYAQLVDLMMETTFQTELGQLLDTMCDNLELSDFSLDRWTSIVTYKTAFYSFYLSVAFAMVYAGITDQAAYDSARNILIKMGVYFQAQDDYLDCYGTPEQIGKIGTDIESKKCGFLFCHAYNGLTTPKITPEQKKLLDDKYGKCKVGSDDEKKIKALYNELNLEPLYQKYEQDMYDELMGLKDTVKEVPWEVFEVFLKKIFKRSK